MARDEKPRSADQALRDVRGQVPAVSPPWQTGTALLFAAVQSEDAKLAG
jgi:hypothetical protein